MEGVNSFDWVSTRLYGPNEDSIMCNLLDKTKVVPQRWDVVWCIKSDFNVVTQVSSQA